MAASCIMKQNEMLIHYECQGNFREQLRKLLIEHVTPSIEDFLFVLKFRLSFTEFELSWAI